ncbi:glycoside hydrolase family 104 protein [Kushneria phosphatilytica]|uniref:Glycoside hydrolase family 104 protein n=1 Tax=Kushneria phosphatilytica TaxID=657387 RepID=A0A1S1NS94_9GAMM|nr:glycoside hydrolase family 104 protein [Kushneria phosphatilytica]OHV12134.1 hypothetical protein BH688_05635 [Kushneria phosphatilytica]QEL11328.1 glycoside hydrolase family 104 protein [Kushneria phosphatilytica]
MPRITPSEAGSYNLCAMIDAIAVSEGTASIGSDDGYNVLVGGETFSGYSEHPDRVIDLPSLGIHSSAAGRYQFLADTWDWAEKSISLDDFRPINQDRAALFLIDYRGATEAVKRGDIRKAIEQCRKEWASLPGAGYGQHENSAEHVIQAYMDAGGELKHEEKDWFDRVVKDDAG